MFCNEYSMAEDFDNLQIILNSGKDFLFENWPKLMIV